MSKYSSLTTFLKDSDGQPLRLSFQEIEKILGFPLPPSKKYQAWWSNNPSNNVMTKAWLEAGYRTEQVDVAGERLVFAPSPWPAKEPAPKLDERDQAGHSPLFGSMKGTTIVLPGVDLTKPADPDWEKVYE